MNIELLKDKKVFAKATNTELTYLDVIVMNTYFEGDNNYEYESVLEIRPIYDDEKDVRTIRGDLCYDKMISEFEAKYGKKLHHVVTLRGECDNDWDICKVNGADEYYGVCTYLEYNYEKKEYTHAICDINKINITKWDYILIERARDGSTWDKYISDQFNADSEEFWTWAEQYIKAKVNLIVS